MNQQGKQDTNLKEEKRKEKKKMFWLWGQSLGGGWNLGRARVQGGVTCEHAAGPIWGDVHA